MLLEGLKKQKRMLEAHKHVNEKSLQCLIEFLYLDVILVTARKKQVFHIEIRFTNVPQFHLLIHVWIQLFLTKTFWNLTESEFVE